MSATDGVEAISLFSAHQFDLILLDIMLPKIDGFAVCELIRKQSQVPIIMLTALNGEEEQIRGLDLQVDDYITKPFSIPILIRKIAAVLRRSTQAQNDTHITSCVANAPVSVNRASAPLSLIAPDTAPKGQIKHTTHQSDPHSPHPLKGCDE